MEQLRSTVLYHGQPIDGTALTLSYEFYQLTHEQLHSLTHDALMFVFNIADNGFVANWNVNGKSFWKLDKKRMERFDGAEPYDFYCEAFCKSELVFDSKSFRKQSSRMERDILVLSRFTPGLSMDYRQEWNSLFPQGRPDRGEIKSKVQQLFTYENRKYTSVYCMPDLSAFFVSDEYTHHKKLYYGRFSISISAFCIGSMLDDFASLFYAHMLNIAARYCNLNARVMLEPTGRASEESPYMRYFGSHANVDGSHLETGHLPNEWYRSYYVRGIEWANVVSPLAQTHLDVASILKKDETGIEAQILTGGGLLMKSQSKIDGYSLDDARKMKRLLYPSLFPGYSSISLRRLFEENVPDFFMADFPRSDWATVPILDGEIEVIGTDLVFTRV